MELHEIIWNIRTLKSKMNLLEKRLITDYTLTLEDIKRLESEWETLDDELESFREMLPLPTLTPWTGHELEEPPSSEEEEEEEDKEKEKEEGEDKEKEKEKEEEIDYSNPPEWLVKKWEEERDSWTNYNAYGSEAFDLADEV